MNQTVHDTTESAKDTAREVGSQAQEKAKDQVDGRSTQAGEQLQDKADSLHAVGDQMRERGDDTFAQIADRVAGWTEDAAKYLREADANRMLGDVETYARRQPWAVAAGGVLLGFAASRVVRAGTDARRQSSESLGYGSSYEALGAERDVDLRTGADFVGAAGAGTGYAATGGTGYTDDLGADPLGNDFRTSTTDYGTHASIAPEPGQDVPPAVPPVPDVSPVPDSNPSPLGDPTPGNDPESTGFYRPSDVDR
ncbi:hypothetical protein [Aquipuribacter sp. MA13-6]|uniref:hypothetical protein n=1 Tax=unclassified Aquipuribacter TaxID=2635084 RepID=UPI003EE8648E